MPSPDVISLGRSIAGFPMVKLFHDAGAKGDRERAVRLLRKRLKEFEALDGPPGTWDRSDFELALVEAERGNYNRACRLLEMPHNALRDLVYTGVIDPRRLASTSKRYRHRIEAIDASKKG